MVNKTNLFCGGHFKLSTLAGIRVMIVTCGYFKKIGRNHWSDIVFLQFLKSVLKFKKPIRPATVSEGMHACDMCMCECKGLHVMCVRVCK